MTSNHSTKADTKYSILFLRIITIVLRFYGCNTPSLLVVKFSCCSCAVERKFFYAFAHVLLMEITVECQVALVNTSVTSTCWWQWCFGDDGIFSILVVARQAMKVLTYPHRQATGIKLTNTPLSASSSIKPFSPKNNFSTAKGDKLKAKIPNHSFFWNSYLERKLLATTLELSHLSWPRWPPFLTSSKSNDALGTNLRRWTKQPGAGTS